MKPYHFLSYGLQRHKPKTAPSAEKPYMKQREGDM